MRRSGLLAGAVGFTAALLASACLAESARNDCAFIEPNILPDGSRPGLMREGFDAYLPQRTWGEGRNAVLEVVVRHDRPVALTPTEGVFVRGGPAEIAVPDASRPSLTWALGECEYRVWLDSSLSAEDIAAYAARF